MNTQITSVKENALLDRKDVTVEIDHEGEATPSREDIKSRIAAEKTLDEENIEVGSIKTGFGRQKSETLLKINEDFEYDETLEEDTIETDVETEETHREIADMTISEAKDFIKNDDNPDYQAYLEVEQNNKNRKTLVEWIENR